MVSRRFWIDQVERALGRRSVLWLSGVRRAGKTFLCRSLRDVEVLDCELPGVRRLVDDPEAFLAARRGRRVVLDEIHRLGNPSELLKIAADHYPDVKIVATGSSTLAATARFRDTLVGRKAELWLTPMMTADLEDFGGRDLTRRLARGGLPPFFLAEEVPARDYQEWMDAFWAKDIQELFRLERRQSFQRLLELLFRQSGGIFEATSFARPCEVSRATISNYLAVLEATFTVNVLRPFSSRGASEIVAAPKVYAFDTGFVAYHRGWQPPRPDDVGILWEHYVLNEVHARLQTRDVLYWRDKRGHEVDFVLAPPGRGPVAIECKGSVDDFDAAGLKAFRARYPEGRSFVVAPRVEPPFQRRLGAATVEFVDLPGLVAAIAETAEPQPTTDGGPIPPARANP